MNPRPPGYEPGELPDCSTPRRCARAGNGTRTRDPNLGKVVLYQLSYSRVGRQSNRSVGFFVPPLPPPYRPCRPFSGGEGDRTPDLVNAIHALSQLSYAPAILGAPPIAFRKEHGILSGRSWSVKRFPLDNVNFPTLCAVSQGDHRVPHVQVGP